jgi:acetyl esterase
MASFADDCLRSIVDPLVANGLCITQGDRMNLATPAVSRRFMNSRFLNSVITLLFACVTVSYAQGNRPVGKDVVYKTVDGKPLHLYISSPPETDKGPHAAIVFFHGGGGVAGAPAQFNRQSTALAALGMVAIEVQYRLMAPPPSMESPRICVEDAKSASGGSAGGYLAAAVAMVPGWDDPADDLSISTKPGALVLFFPGVDITPGHHNGAERFGPDWTKYAPETYLSAKTPPTIIFAGTEDRLVTPEALKKYKALADKVGNRCELDFYPGQRHGFANKEPYTTQTLDQAIVFLKSLGYLPSAGSSAPAQ